MTSVKKENILNEFDLSAKEILSSFPLRISLTDYCNARCFFCSNEGMPLWQKNKNMVEPKKLSSLLLNLKKKGLKRISLTGGEPSLHPDILKIVDFINELNFEETFFHTNGIALSRELIDKLRAFSKIAVSVHAVGFNTWSKITKGTKQQHQMLHQNLQFLKENVKDQVIEIKHVPIKNLNDKPDTIKDTLDLCSQNKFKFKFLNFEPITKDQLSLVKDVKDIEKIICQVGGERMEKEKKFRGQTGYLPIEWFKYGDAKGVVIEIGCGQPSVCKNCYKSNEIFLNPLLEIKPCHISSHRIPIENENNKDELIKKIIESRMFLKTCPGVDRDTWLDNE